MEINKEFKKKIIEFKRVNLLTSQEIAENLGMKPQIFSNLLNGRKKIIEKSSYEKKIKTLSKIIRFEGEIFK